MPTVLLATLSKVVAPTEGIEKDSWAWDGEPVIAAVVWTKGTRPMA